LRKDINLIWDSFEKDRHCEGDKLLLRRLHSIGLHIGIDLSRNQKILLIEVKNLKNINLEELPLWKGIKPVLIKLTSDKDALILKLIDVENIDIFNALIRDIDDSLSEVKDLDSALLLFKDRMDKWRLFFEKYGNIILGSRFQRGLFGELYFLKNHVLPVSDHIKAIKYWKGHDRNAQDFSFPNGNLEVKTTIKKEPVTVTINNEKQLDDRGIKSLYLYCLMMNRVESSGYSLPDIVKEIRDLLFPYSGTTTLFNNFLNQSGYIDEHIDYYRDNRYIIKKEQLYEVKEGFPRIINLPEGTGDIQYSIVLSSCKKFEVNIKETLKKLLE